MAPIPPTLGDFSVLPISIPPVPSFPRTTIHYVYVRRNAPKVPTANNSRSLFLTNVPVDSTELHLRGIFTALVGAGRFQSATFEDDRKGAESLADAQPAQVARLHAHHQTQLSSSTSSQKKRKRGEGEDAERAQEEAAARLPSTWTRPLHGSGGTAVVLLADEKSIEQVLKAIAKLHRTNKYPTWGDNVEQSAAAVPRLGSVWLKAHSRLSYPDRDALQAALDAFSTLFARKEQEAAAMAKRLRNEPDEDGFVTVTRGGRNAPASKNEAEEARKKMVEREEKRKEEDVSFYRFQRRERKKEEQADLLQRFEEDRKKVFAMRQQRGKFVPEA
ncbi:ribosomal RNA-processing protein 7-domain-containing protein [Bombardia bombarda]|uniref:Ribosomal RNA-processing protein 7-domain-containing protein n=1 Tax=Bombardia bombarda TaxID=252184 RepID=A0AA39XJG6_9PEZI|nr:ribosomal RNA-processing protein 7-domain-containing protein [Bombardia bombarda]